MKKHPEQTAATTRAALAAALTVALATTGCSSTPPTVVPGPLQAAPLQPALFVERPNNGAIFQPYMTANSLFSGERRPQAIGDTLKVNIAEKIKAEQDLGTTTSRSNQMAVKGPGGSSKSTFINSLLNANTSASGSDGYTGSGKATSNGSFDAQLAVSVINVLPNGHLLVAGERRIGLDASAQVLRFSGVVDPQNIRPGNQVDSADVVNASLENVAQGDMSDAARRNWLQRVLTRATSVW
ncbi:flagellar basal body L-ring protein FlgH [Paucibacter sp. R3-3]|uniref:Flagellar basal body L-ring protein FlgH n=1 Tax=Roseateles agri TaxID=3098619 RepID=A0ABU5DMK3_9BURK|nr:flagellar basal body L-ring protein FlgH [Paucibacter sp. R3-3]MDY0746504.1 flagellar basal body L-ring protein FlgH [Paucibacter sp. R3-3]